MIATLIAQVESLKDAAPADGLALDSVILGEQFYFFTVVLMWLIHAGFMSYEAGVAPVSYTHLTLPTTPYV